MKENKMSIWGIISDTHNENKMNAIPHIMEAFRKKGVKTIIHCGDIDPCHLKPELFLNLPVVCALTEGQVQFIKEQIAPKLEFSVPLPNWEFTVPRDRIRLVNGVLIYLGHKLSFDILNGPESELRKTIDTIRRDYDGIRMVFAGHTHHQIFIQDHLVNFINPGAVQNSYDGYEYAIIDTDRGEIVFSRIPKTKPVRQSFTIGIISDSLNVSELDAEIWGKLAQEMRDRGVSHIIHCGNIALQDIGRPELSDFKVYYNLRADKLCKNTPHPNNWELLDQVNPVVEINGYRFCVQLDLGAELIEKSEFDMQKLSLERRRKYPEISFILCGFINDAFYEEGEQIRIINPGDLVKDRSFATITLPTTEITFSSVPVDPLPLIEQAPSSKKTRNKNKKSPLAPGG